MAFSREFDYPERFEREKSTRIMPDSLEVIGFYTLRMMAPPGESPFAIEFASAVTDVQDEHDQYRISYVIKMNEEEDFGLYSSNFNQNGFMVIANDDDQIPGYPEEIEMAYFVGSLDPFDLAFGDLIKNARELSATAS